MAVDKEHAHPSEAEYVKVAVALGIATALEVAIFYVTALRSLIVVLLIPLMFVKFALVALWFMHLKFDSKLFRRLFIAGIIFAISVYTVAVVTLIGTRT